MKEILIVDTFDREDEVRQKINDFSLNFIHSHELNDEILKSYHIVFDFSIDENPENLLEYFNHKHLVVFLNSVKTTLNELVFIYGNPNCTIFGFNGLKTFFNRNILECTTLNEENSTKLAEICKQFSTNYIVVNDRVGMVTPRVVFMIINEACFAFQEGTASISDIDTGMKLGTNYPYGPFEWADKIGIKDVYETIESIYEDTKDERYKICSLLKTYYLRNERFIK